MMNRRTGRVAAIALALAAAGLFAVGCGGSGGTTLQGAPSIYPETVNLARGGKTTFFAGTVEVDDHKVSEGYRIQEKEGGSFVTGENLVDNRLSPAPARYTAPDRLGTYHLQYVWDAGTKREKSATATIMVTDMPPYTAVTP